MARWQFLTGAALALAVVVSCGPAKTEVPVPTALPIPTAPADQLFPSPYFPSHDTVVLGRPVQQWSAGWTAACVYTEAALDDRQKAFVATLQPAGGEGQVGAGFTADFDGDGKDETVSYGAWAKGPGDEGNFVLVTRPGADGPQVLLLKELPGPPRFTVFTKKPDGSLWFGGGIDAGEVTMKITWDGGTPVFSLLGPD
jgi:hypothetical protein